VKLTRGEGKMRRRRKNDVEKAGEDV